MYIYICPCLVEADDYYTGICLLCPEGLQGLGDVATGGEVEQQLRVQGPGPQTVTRLS